MSAQIRLATVDDAPSIQSIYAPYVEDTVISFELIPPSVNEMAGRIQKTICTYPWLVYVTDDQQIGGYVYASSHSERAAYQWSTNVSVYVGQHYHRRRIGRGLYTALFMLLREQGYFNAYAGITLPNEASVGIHTALGFELVGVYKQVGYKFGAWYDVGWWALPLNALASKPIPPRPITELVDTPVWSDAIQTGLTLIHD
jgi:L-amino acid N-acyltransferase YncA